MSRNPIARNSLNWAFPLFLFLSSILTACVKNVELIPVGTTSTTSPGSSTSTTSPGSLTGMAGQKLVAQGSFVNGVHTVKGAVGIYEKDGKHTLVFTDFSTDSGPDLRIYLAEDAALTNFVEASKLTTTGNFSVDLPTSYNPNQHKAVLIWCKPFSVLFGSAMLTR